MFYQTGAGFPSDAFSGSKKPHEQRYLLGNVTISLSYISLAMGLDYGLHSCSTFFEKTCPRCETKQALMSLPHP